MKKYISKFNLAEETQLDEAVFAAEKFPQVTRIITKAIQKYTGLKVQYTGKEKIYLGSDQLYVANFNVGPTYVVRFGFTSPYGETLKKISVVKPNIKYEVVVDESAKLIPAIEDLAKAIVEGSKASQSTYQVIKHEKEVPILSNEEKEFEKEYEELLVKESDLKARIELLKDVVRDVGGIHNGVIISGTAGIGKTHTVRDVIENELGWSEGVNYSFYSGGKITPAALYKILEKDMDKCIIFDDLDSMWYDLTMSNMLKGALQTSGPRRVTYGSVDTQEGFDFQGSIIFITNLTKTQLLKYGDPVLDRIPNVHFDITKDELMNYILGMLEVIMPGVPIEIKEEAFAFYKKFGPKYSSAKYKDLSIRAFTKTVEQVMKGEPAAVWKKRCVNIL
jgi:hypothetical protein